MSESFYSKIFDWLDAHQGFKRVMLVANSGLRVLGYIAYPALLVFLVLTQPDRLVYALVVPATGFGVVTLLRMLLNWPRPYEVFEFIPLVPKNTKGRSFPSRHVCSLVLIAGIWLWVCVPVGVLLLALSVILAVIRVAVGVHFPRDVVAGYVLGLLWTALAFLLV